MAARRRRVVLLASADALAGLEGVLRRAGVDAVRLEVLRPRRRPASRWLAGTPDPARLDAVVLTSGYAIRYGLLPWRRSHPGRGVGPELWAAGPRTAATLRRLKIGPVRRGQGLGRARILAGFPLKGRRVLYLRSDRAGPQLGRALRRRGHRVTERVVYETRIDSEVVRRRTALLRDAALLVVTSPSALSALRRGAGARRLRDLAENVPIIVLGSRSASVARRAGFRRVVTAPESTPQSFARRLVRELEHAPK